MNNQVPKWAMWFLEKTCKPAFLDELEGDLLELFDRDIQRLGLSKARRNFIWRSIFSLRWYRLPGFEDLQPTLMYKNHLKVAYRHAFKHQSVTTVQFLGLLFGLMAAFYIGLFIKNELAYDQMHENNSELYRVLKVNPNSGQRNHSTSSLHGASLAEEFPFISVCRFGNDPVKIGDQSPLLVEDFYWSDSTFFELFSFKFIHGNPKTCLDEVNSLVITESTSKQLFATTDALGKTIKVKVYDGDQEFLMTVRGIVEDPPKYSHIQFKALGAMANAENLYGSLLKQWGFSWLRTYIRVTDQRIAEVEAGIPNLIEKYVAKDIAANFTMTFQPFDEVYLYSQDIPKNTFKGDIKNLRIFGAIGLLILLISLMNYINLATARAVTRTKEIGIRKVLGSQKNTIIAQFIVESMLFITVSGLLAMVLLIPLLPYLNSLLQLDISWQLLSWRTYLFTFLSLLLVGIVAGTLPSLAISKLPTLSNTKASIQFKPNQWSITRKLFVGLQYGVTLVLLIATFVIYHQYTYLKSFDKGFDSEQLLHISVNDRALQKQLGVMKEKIGKLSGVVGVTATGEDLPSELNNTWDLTWSGAHPEQQFGVDIIGVDKEYFDLLDIPFKAGHNFTKDFAIDSARSVVLNEQALALIDQADMVGHQVTIGGSSRTLIGVVENYHNTSLHTQVPPIAYFIYPPGFRVSPDNLLVKLEAKNMPHLIAQLEETWQNFSPDAFEYNFVDEAFAAAYSTEREFNTLIGAFTCIAIIISIIGLFGFINFITQFKLREISIRRILGATTPQLMQLLGRDFLMVFSAALVLALPTAYYLMSHWLANYAYHVDVSVFVLGLAVFICMGISTLVIFYHLRRSIRLNPAEVLSSE